MKTKNPKGGRPPKVGEKRSELIGMRVTPSEKAEIESRAAIAGLAPSDYSRSLSLGFKPSAPSSGVADPAVISLLNRLALETSRVGNNVNQLARVVHRGREIPEWWREAAGEVKTVSAEIRTTLERLLR